MHCTPPNKLFKQYYYDDYYHYWLRCLRLEYGLQVVFFNWLQLKTAVQSLLTRLSLQLVDTGQ